MTDKPLKQSVEESEGLTFPSRHTTQFQRLQDVYTTSATQYKRFIAVETTPCVYRVVQFKV